MSSAQAPNFTTPPYIIQSILLLLGPTLFAASIYMVLGRIIILLDAADYSVIRPKRLTAVFVTGDVLSFLAQGGGKGAPWLVQHVVRWLADSGGEIQAAECSHKPRLQTQCSAARTLFLPA